MNVRLIALFAGLTLRETVRRRTLWVLLGLSLISVALVAWGVDVLVSTAREDGVGELQLRFGVSQVLILIAFMFSFVLAMSGAFLAAPAIASEVESGIVLAMLARPVRRGELVVGHWLGLALVTVGYTVLSGALAIAVVGLISGYTPPTPAIALFYLSLEALVVVTLALALGTRLPSVAAGAIAVVAFGLAWFAGVLGGVAEAFDATSLAGVTELMRFIVPTDGLWRGVVFGLEPPIAVLLALGRGVQGANPFFASEPPPLPFVVWSITWIVLVLAAAIVAFRRREL
jgi:ABC-type transport system involved in multi-copper enzyme maturation permease subunit